MKVRTVIISIVALALVGAVGFKVKQKLDQKAALSRQTMARGERGGTGTVVVKALTIERQPIKETLRVVGDIEADQEFALQPQISGRLARVLVNEGDRVSVGQQVAVLDDETFRLQLEQEEAALATANANLQKARIELARAKTEKDRYHSLLQQKYISQNEYENVENTYLSAQASVDALQAQLASSQKSYELTRHQLGQTQVYSPTAGVVLTRPLNPGVNVTTGTTLMTVASLARVKLKFHIDQRDAFKAQKGATVIFSSDAFPGKQFQGKVTETAPVYDPQTRSLSLSVLLANHPVQLVPGMFGAVELVLDEKSGALVVPQEAVVNRGGQSGVYVVSSEGIATFHQVQIGLMAGGMTELTTGIDEGDLVVVLGQNRLRGGEKVQLLADGQNAVESSRPGRPQAGGAL